MKLWSRSLLCLALLCAALVIVAAAWIPFKLPWRACRPAFLEIAGGKSIDVKVGSHEFGIKAALIGCDTDLQAISPRQEEQIISLIKETLHAETWRAWPGSKERGFRLSLTKKINGLLGRSAVCDVYLHSFSSAE